VQRGNEQLLLEIGARSCWTTTRAGARAAVGFRAPANNKCPFCFLTDAEGFRKTLYRRTTDYRLSLYGNFVTSRTSKKKIGKD